jgi:hypothetical protein
LQLWQSQKRVSLLCHYVNWFRKIAILKHSHTAAMPFHHFPPHFMFFSTWTDQNALEASGCSSVVAASSLAALTGRPNRRKNKLNKKIIKQDNITYKWKNITEHGENHI